jgi:hypothetical protein
VGQGWQSYCLRSSSGGEVENGLEREECVVRISSTIEAGKQSGQFSYFRALICAGAIVCGAVSCGEQCG